MYVALHRNTATEFGSSRACATECSNTISTARAGNIYLYFVVIQSKLADTDIIRQSMWSGKWDLGLAVGKAGRASMTALEMPTAFSAVHA